jgi:hypothetical protein
VTFEKVLWDVGYERSQKPFGWVAATFVKTVTSLSDL